MSDTAAFRFSIQRLDAYTIEVEYAGYMPEKGEFIARTEAMVRASSAPVGICYTVPDFTGFHRSQVQQHGDMFSRLGDLVTGIAVIEPRAVVRFGAITVGMISNTPVKTFDQLAGAIEWLESLRTESRRG